jgi:ABC-type Fe3+-hydroxamate transport system substrate-binding protein
MHILVILQNAYGVPPGYIPSYDKPSFRNCHTGRRLRRALPETAEISIINSNPQVGEKADSYFKPDYEYVKNKFDELKPDVILACGTNGKKILETLEFNIPAIHMPHPAYRALTNKLLDEIRIRLDAKN